MSFNSNKKAEHEQKAAAAMEARDYRLAAIHWAKAAEFTLKLADLSEDRIRRGYVDEARDLVEIAEGLHEKAKTAPKPQKPIAVQDDGVSEEEEDWLITEKPAVRFDDLAGMEDVKTKLSEMVIEPIKHPEKAAEWGIKAGGGILLFGPPGNGKTTLGKAVASELGAPFFYATGAQIRSKWHGESEQRLRKLIQSAKSKPVSVLFLDDVDGLLPKRGGDSVVDNRVVVQFLSEVGGFEESPNVLLILGATNKPWAIDEAVFRTGRFDEKIFVGLPDGPAREFLVKKAIGKAPVDSSVDPAALAARLEGYTGSDIVAIVLSAKRAGFKRSVSGAAALTAGDIEKAMKTIPSSATAKMMKQYAEFAAARFT